MAAQTFDPKRATANEWARYHAFRRRRHDESEPEEPHESDRVHEVELAREDPQEMRPLLVSDDGSETVAAAQLVIPRPDSPGFESNRGIVWSTVYVLRDHRRRGLARSFLQPIAELAREHECRVIGSEAFDEEGKAALESLGMEARFSERKSRLDLAAVDWEMVERWADDGRRRNAGSELVRYLGFPPRAEWPAYSKAVTELFNDIPWEGLDHGDVVITPETLAELDETLRLTGRSVLSFQVKDASGAVLGLTEMAVSQDHPEHAWQWLTAVSPSARKRGIGRWLKADLLLHLRRRHPRLRWVLTDNAGSNAPMLKINDALGFAPYKVLTYFQMPFAEFEKRAST